MRQKGTDDETLPALDDQDGVTLVLNVEDDVPSPLLKKPRDHVASLERGDVIMKSSVVDGETLPVLDDQDGIASTLIMEDGVLSRVSLMGLHDHVAYSYTEISSSNPLPSGTGLNRL